MPGIRHVKHLKSNVVEQSGYPKIPAVNALEYGEIAVNYAEGLETISLKNSNNSVVTFKPNTNIFIKNFLSPITINDVCNVLSVGNVYNYQDFNISFLDVYGNNLNLYNILDHIRTNYYDVCNIHVLLNVAKSNDLQGNHTNFYINSEAMQDMIDDSQKPISNKSVIVGFTKYDEYFIAGDSTAMNGIEINWDKTTKTMFVRYVYMNNVYRMNGNTIG